MTDPTVDDLVQRLDRLQLRNRRLKKWLTVLLIIGVIVMAIHYNWPRRKIIYLHYHIFLDTWDSGFVSAMGTWNSDADKTLYPPVFPDKASKIVCYRELGYCFESIATFRDNLLAAELDTLEIERWDRENIITRPQSEGICGEHVMRINRALRSVDALITRRGEGGLCDGFPKEQRLRLGERQ